MAIQAGMTVLDLDEAELADSPQHGPAKDPINMEGDRGLRPAARGSPPGRRQGCDDGT
jgi:hypothetical protein